MTGSKQMFITSLDQTYTEDLEGVGAIRREGNKEYKWVLFSEGTGAVAAVVGNAVYYRSTSGYEISEVTSDVSNGTEIGAGILLNTPADGEYCWIQIKGFATMASGLAASALDGDPLTATGSTDGKLAKTTAVTDVIVAIGIDVSAFEIMCDFPY